MAHTYTLFIDESGEAGINKIRTTNTPGASPYMTLGGVLIRDGDTQEFHTHIDSISAKLNSKTLHCSELRHVQKVYFARDVSTLRLKLFGLVSQKSTLGWYADQIERDSKKYYNKCAQYILERAGLFVKSRNLAPEQLFIVFEEGNFNYQNLRNFVSACQLNPLHQNAKLLGYINPQQITTRKKIDEPVLKIADLVAHALFKCVDKTQGNYFIPEPRYFGELRDTFFKHPETNRITDGGLKLVHSANQLALDPEILDLFANV